MSSDPGDDLLVTSSVRVPRRELEYVFTTSGGPGGQHANRSHTRVEITFDVEASTAFSEAQRERVLARLGSVVRVAADDERSQLRNRALAEERLVERLRGALHVARPRRATRPTKSSQRRRLDSKTKRSTIKQNRRRPAGDD